MTGKPVPFVPVGQAVQEIADGGMVVVVDEGRADEGVLVMAAAHATPADLAFLVRHTSGLVCVALTGERCEALELPLMVGDDPAGDRPAFTVTVDLSGTTGISAADRAATLRALADPAVPAAALARPGHVLPVRARDGGVLARGGHAEAAVDLARLAGLAPAGVLCPLVDDDGDLARRPDLLRFAARHGLPTLTVAGLVAHRRRSERPVERTGDARVPTPAGEFRCIGYRAAADGVAHRATEHRATEPLRARSTPARHGHALV